MKDRKPSLKPGEAENYRSGLRYRRHQDGTLVVDARVWSALRNNWVKETHASVSDAKDWMATQRTGRIHGQEVDPKRAKLPFAVIAAEWLAHKPGKSKRTCQTDAERLKRVGVDLHIEGEGTERKVTIVGRPTWFAARPIGAIDITEVTEMVETLQVSGLSPNTVAGTYSTVRAVFFWAEDYKALPKRNCVFRDIKNRPEWKEVERPVHRPDDADDDEYAGIKSVSNDELIALAEALGPAYELAVWLGVCFGLRYEEVFGLTVESVASLMAGRVEIEHTVDRDGTLRPNTTKTAAGDRYIIDRDLSADIGDHMARRGITLNSPPDTLLFVNARSGGPLTYSAWHKIWRRALVKAGLDWKKRNGQRLGLHDLRSMNRTIMEEVGVPGVTARKRFGHAGSRGDQLTDRYARSTARANRLASESIHTVVRRARVASEGRPVLDRS